MDVLLKLNRSSVLAVTKTTNANILSFAFADGQIETKWVIRDNDFNVIRVNELPYLEKMMIGVSLDPQDDGRLKVSFSMPIALDNLELFFSKLPDGYDQIYGIVFDDQRGPSYIKEVFVDIEACLSYCRCVVLSSGADFIEKVPVNLGLLKNLM